MSYSKYTEKDIDEMVFLAKRLGSYRAAAREFGCSFQCIADHCHKRGLHIESMQDKSKRTRKISINGIVFSEGNGCWRTCINRERITASDYVWRLTHNGEKKPRDMVARFRNGNSEDYSLDNVYFIKTTEFLHDLTMSRYEENKKVLEDARNEYFANERNNTNLKNRRCSRAWRTRRRNDPDNTFAQKGVASRRANAEIRGYFFTPEQRQKMSEAHKGKTRQDIAIARREAEKAGIRAKLGMNF